MESRSKSSGIPFAKDRRAFPRRDAAIIPHICLGFDYTFSEQVIGASIGVRPIFQLPFECNFRQVATNHQSFDWILAASTIPI